MTCTVCNHPQRRHIDLALLTGEPVRSLQERYGPSKSALSRHKKHLEDTIRDAQARLQTNQQHICLIKLHTFLDHVERGVKTAVAAADIDKVFKGSQIASRIIHQINKMDPTWQLDNVYRLLSSPNFAFADNLQPLGSGFIAELHQALVEKLFFSCPDDDEDQDTESPPGTVASHLEALRSFLGIADTPPAALSWDTGGTTAAQTPPACKETVQNQANTNAKKNPPGRPETAPETPPPAADPVNVNPLSLDHPVWLTPPDLLEAKEPAADVPAAPVGASGSAAMDNQNEAAGIAPSPETRSAAIGKVKAAPKPDIARPREEALHPDAVLPRLNKHY